METPKFSEKKLLKLDMNKFDEVNLVKKDSVCMSIGANDNCGDLDCDDCVFFNKDNTETLIKKLKEDKTWDLPLI